MTLDAPLDAALDPACVAATNDAARLLEQLGHSVEEVDAPWKGTDILPVFSVLWAATVAASVMHAELISGRQATESDVEPLTWWLNQEGRGHNAPTYIGAVAMMQAFARGVIGLWGQCDVLLTPALGQRPVRHGEVDPCGENPAYEFKKSAEFTPFTAPFNVTGQPAISVPLFHGDDGLPTAVQLVGPPAGEGLLLALCAQLEAARPWAERAPEESATA